MNCAAPDAASTGAGTGNPVTWEWRNRGCVRIVNKRERSAMSGKLQYECDRHQWFSRYAPCSQCKKESELAAPTGSANRQTKKFCCSYHHDGAEWALDIDAYDWADAESRVSKLGYLRLDGELMGVVSCGWIARLVCWVKNAFR